MQVATFRNAFLGFLAAALAVVTVHQLVFLLLSSIGLTKYQPWSLNAIGPLGLPAIVNNLFWGGIWGVPFAVVWRLLPGSSMGVKGAIFGVLGPLLTGRWIVVPLIKGEPLFANLVPSAMVSSFLAISAFGAALGWLYSRFTSMQR